MQIVNGLLEQFGIVVDWSSQNAIQYLQDLGNRIANYRIATGLAYIIVTNLLFCSTFLITICFKRWHEKNKEMDKDDDFVLLSYFLFGVMAFTAAIFAIVGTPMQVFTIVKAKYLPEMTVLDFINDLMITQG